MKVYGYEITDDVITKARETLLSRKSFTFHDAQVVLVRLGVPDTSTNNNSSTPAYRGGDRLLQNMRKEGLIECKDRKNWTVINNA